MMSPARFSQLWGGITNAAQKVYESVPIESELTYTQIMGDLSRRGINTSYKIMSGCVDSLVRSGLVKENRSGFVRVGVRPAKVASLQELSTILPKEQKAINMPVTQPKTDLIEDISKLAQHIAATTARHKQEMDTIVDMVNDMAIEVQAEFERNATDLGKMRQFKDLLHSLGG